MVFLLSVSNVLVSCHNWSYPFMTPIAKPAASPPVRGMPRFPVIVEICPVSVNEWASVDTNPCDIDWILSQFTLIRFCAWKYISAAKNKPTITASILNIRFIANPARNPIRPPEPIVNNVGATASSDNITS